jgi:HPr kinase/phosphorylase
VTGRAQIHASCVAIAGDGVLLTGPSGSGKSDFAMRLLSQGAALVADDRVDLWAKDGVLHAAPPPRLAGLIEVRGVGVVSAQALGAAVTPDCAVRLAVDLVESAAVPRLPVSVTRDFAGVPIPLLRLAPFEASACAKLRLALVGGDRQAENG